MFLQPLRVPLDRQAKGVTGQLDGFDQLVGGVGHHSQGRGDLLETLVMQAVHLKGIPTQDLRQPARAIQADRMGQVVAWDVGKPVMLQRAGMRHDIGIDPLIVAAKAAEAFFGRPLPGVIHRTGVIPAGTPAGIEN